jgi:hypothetical protein
MPTTATATIAAAAQIGFNNNGQYRAALLADHPVRLYELNDVGGPARDTSGNNGPSGTYGSSVTQAPSICPSDYGGFSARMPLAANTSYDANAIVEFPDDPAINFNGTSFSVEFIYSWPYTGAGSPNFGGQNCYFVNLQDETGLMVGHPPGNSKNIVNVNGVQVASGIQDLFAYDQPVHHVFTYDAVAQMLYIYVDGYLIESVPAAPGTFNSGTGLRIGQRGTGSQPTQNSDFQYVSIFNYVLTQSQVTNHANAAGINNYSYTGGGSVLRSAGASAKIGTNQDENYQRAVIADHPLRYYRLNDTNSTALDTSGNNGPSGTWGTSVLHGGSIVASDYVDGSAQFPSSGNTSPDPNSIITFPEDPPIQFNGTSFSIEYFYTWNADNSNFSGQECSYINLEDNTGVRVAFPPSQSLQTKVYFNGAVALTTGRGAYIGVPNHCVITYNASTSLLSYYQNGLLQSTATVNGATFNSGIGLRLGQRGTGTLPALNGDLSDVAIYGSALSATQVQNHANAAGVNSYPGGTVTRYVGAAMAIATHSLGTTSINAAMMINVSGNATINAAAHIVSKGMTSIGAASRISVPAATKTIGAAMAVAIKSSASILGEMIVSAKITQSMGAAMRVTKTVQPTIGAAMAVQQSTSQSMRANMVVRMPSSMTIGAAMHVAALPMTTHIGAAMAIVDVGYAQIGAGMRVLGVVKKTIGAAMRISVGNTLSMNAGAYVVTAVQQSIGAGMCVKANFHVFIGAASRIVNSNTKSIGAAMLIGVPGTLGIIAEMHVSKVAKVSIGAAMFIYGTVRQTIGAGMSIIATTQKSIGARASVVNVATQTIGAAMNVIPTNYVQGGAGMIVAQTVQQSIGAGMMTFQIENTFRVLPANMRIIANGTISIGAGMMIAFETGVMSIGAGMMIFAPFVPNLAANMYVVNIGSMSIAAGMRIGRVTTSFVNRELYAEPYYGQD